MPFYYRTYFDKDTVIFKDSLLNLGANPVADLYYGGSIEQRDFSRYIFHFNEGALIEKYNQCKFKLDETKHILNLKLTYFFGDNIDNCIPSSFKLCLYKIDQDWTEGCGYDYECESCDGIVENACGKSNGAANWLYAKEGELWDQSGVIDTLTGSPTLIACSEFDCNSEGYLSFDLTDEINNMITGSTVNYGYLLAFEPDLEHFTVTDCTQHVGIYTRNTFTFFEPFLESQSEKFIEDNRNSFYLNVNNKLYLHTHIQGELRQLDQAPNVEIYDEMDNFIISGQTECVDLGIYEYEINLSGTTVTDCAFYIDKWVDLVYNGASLPDVENQFEIKDSTELYDFNNSIYQSKEFKIRFRGINYDEKIQRGDIRKVFVDIFPKYKPDKKLDFYQGFYRIYVQDGPDKLEMFSWMSLNQSFCENWIEIDTSWMIPQEYYIDILIVDKGEQRTYEKAVKFKIEQ